MAYEYDTNGLGVTQHYGVRSIDQKRGGKVAGKGGLVEEVRWVFTYDDLPDASLSQIETSIPANAKIVSAKLEILTPFTSTSTLTDLTVGLKQSDGTVIDADGLITAANATQTAIGAKGLVTGSGALVGTTIGTAAGEVVVAPTVADLLTGKARLIVEYIKEGV